MKLEQVFLIIKALTLSLCQFTGFEVLEGEKKVVLVHSFFEMMK